MNINDVWQAIDLWQVFKFVIECQGKAWKESHLSICTQSEVL